MEPSDAELEDLWRRYHDGRSDQARNRLMLAYLPLVESEAGRLILRLPPHEEKDDLISSGLLGLIVAIERFEPERRVKFETYARRRVRGAMIDGLRSLDWAPRSVRDRARSIEEIRAILEQQLLRTPRLREMAAELEIPVEKLHQALGRISDASLVALDSILSDALDALLEAAPGPDARGSGEELRDSLADAIAGLPDRMRYVITLYFYKGMTLRGIGTLLGVTESRVSRMRTEALQRLRSQLEGDST